MAFLAKKYPKPADLARAIDISPQQLNNWAKEGRPIRAGGRAKVWVLANKHGAKLKPDWLFP